MKVLHVIPSVGPVRGGPSFALQMFTQSLAAAGVAVTVATTDDNGLARLYVPLGQAVAHGPISTWYFRRQTKFYTFSGPLTTWLAKHVTDYDVLHIHALFSYSTLAAAFFAHRNRVPYIIRPLGTLQRWGMSNRRPFIKMLSLRLLESRALEGAALIHYTSEQEKSEAAEVGVTGPSVILPLGIDLSLYENLPDTETLYKRYPDLVGRRIILFLSRIDAKKGLDLLLPAFAQVQQHFPETALVVAGSGDQEYVHQMQDLAGDLGIADSVVWPGFLEGVEKMAAFAAAEVFVLPSYSENFGIVTVEAMAAALPVVISESAGIADLVAQADAGLVVRCEVGEVATALLSLLADAELRSRAGANGRKLAQQRFSLEVMAQDLIEIYQRVLRQ